VDTLSSRPSPRVQDPGIPDWDWRSQSRYIHSISERGTSDPQPLILVLSSTPFDSPSSIWNPLLRHNVHACGSCLHLGSLPWQVHFPMRCSYLWCDWLLILHDLLLFDRATSPYTDNLTWAPIWISSHFLGKYIPLCALLSASKTAYFLVFIVAYFSFSFGPITSSVIHIPEPKPVFILPRLCTTSTSHGPLNAKPAIALYLNHFTDHCHSFHGLPSLSSHASSFIHISLSWLTFPSHPVVSHPSSSFVILVLEH